MYFVVVYSDFGRKDFASRIGEPVREVRSSSDYDNPCNDYASRSLMLSLQYIIPKPGGWL